IIIPRPRVQSDNRRWIRSSGATWLPPGMPPPLPDELGGKGPAAPPPLRAIRKLLEPVEQGESELTGAGEAAQSDITDRIGAGRRVLVVRLPSPAGVLGDPQCVGAEKVEDVYISPDRAGAELEGFLESQC